MGQRSGVTGFERAQKACAYLQVVGRIFNAEAPFFALRAKDRAQFL